MRTGLLFLTAVSLIVFAAANRRRSDEIPFAKHTIDLGASEPCAWADINGDGRLDIVSGENWYEALRWTKHKFRELNFTNNYIDDFSDLPLDVDHDGHVDIVSVSWFSKRMSWWKNPGSTAGTMWKETVIEGSSPIEFAFLVDLDNDGKAQELLPQFGDTKQPLAWYEAMPNGTFARHVVSPQSYGHGIGAGDVYGDGRNDILTPKGWFEAPKDPRNEPWTFHPDWDLTKDGGLGFLHVLDVNGDGKPDIVTSNAHNYGVFWLEQMPDGKWKQHPIDDAFSRMFVVGAPTCVSASSANGTLTFAALSLRSAAAIGQAFPARAP